MMYSHYIHALYRQDNDTLKKEKGEGGVEV